MAWAWLRWKRQSMFHVSAGRCCKARMISSWVLASTAAARPIAPSTVAAVAKSRRNGLAASRAAWAVPQATAAAHATSAMNSTGARTASGIAGAPATNPPATSVAESTTRARESNGWRGRWLGGGGGAALFPVSAIAPTRVWDNRPGSARLIVARFGRRCPW